MKYPMRRDLRARLARLYFELSGLSPAFPFCTSVVLIFSHFSVLPGMDARLVDIATNQAITLLEPKKRIDISDLQLPWRPIYDILEKELFPKQRKTGLTCVSSSLFLHHPSFIPF
jgi:proteasome activator subunit 4